MDTRKMQQAGANRNQRWSWFGIGFAVIVVIALLLRHHGDNTPAAKITTAKSRPAKTISDGLFISRAVSRARSHGGKQSLTPAEEVAARMILFSQQRRGIAAGLTHLN